MSALAGIQAECPAKCGTPVNVLVSVASPRFLENGELSAPIQTQVTNPGAHERCASTLTR